jgi:methyl-accepting chemotaxis protein
LKKIVKNSLTPVNFALETNKLLNKINLTYHDILTLNNLITLQCKFIGKEAFSNLLILNSNKFWIDNLKTATQYFDYQKFSIIYLDSILSLKETLNKPFFASSLLQIFGMFEITQLNYSDCAKNFTELNSENENEFSSGISNAIQLSKEETKEIFDNDPLRLLYIVVIDLLQKEPETIDELVEGILSIISNENYSQSLYSYYKTQIQRGDLAYDKTKLNNFELSDIVSNLTEKFESFKEQLKDLIEILCQEIPGNKKYRIKELVLSCIDDLVLESEEQKNYLISQKIEYTINTFNQLQQVVSLIETCDTSYVGSYAQLYTYLSEDVDIKTVFNESLKIEGLQTQTSYIQVFLDFFKNLK